MKTKAMLNRNDALNKFVNELPGAAALFEKLDLDFCCGGKRALSEVCEEKGLNADDILQRLYVTATVKPSNVQTDWSNASLEELLDHLESTHHVYVKETLPRLAQWLDKVIQAHAANHPELLELKKAFQEVRFDMEPHLMKEENILFPAMRNMAAGKAASGCFGSVRTPIRVMERDHDNIGALLAKIKKTTNNYAPPQDACNTYRALLEGLKQFEEDTHLHVHKENNILFPLAIEVENI